ncbi:hypothetical protein DL93DRAFT_2172823 [Clavulina sp. PMI_390]|nr:hypothetical protein DL93DRAFT_2172823 [Clavulina sp. PMI_390]
MANSSSASSITESADSSIGKGDSPSTPQLRQFSHSLWSPEIARFRAIYFKVILPTIALIIFVMWMALPVYWGSLDHQRTYTDRLKVYLIDHDGSDIGAAVTAAVQANIANTTHSKLGWKIASPDMYPTNNDAIVGLLNEESWMTVVVQPNATANLVAARATGNTSYDPTQAILVYYSQGRNELAANNYLVPYSQALLNAALGAFNAKEVAAYLAAQGTNTTALQTAIKAPWTLSEPVSYTMFTSSDYVYRRDCNSDVRFPESSVVMNIYSAPIATAILLVGSIYIIIFGFVISMTGFVVRAPLEPYLSVRQLLLLRIGAPVTIYLAISLFFAMLSLPYKVPFDARPGAGYAGGFFLYWVFVYLTMCSLGLATEAAIQVLTPRFLTFFLLPLIISNVSVGSVPIDIQPWFYQYGYGFPMYNMTIAVRAIIFNTKNHMGRNAGIILAWIALSIFNIVIVTLWQRRKALRTAAQAAGPAGIEGGKA